MRIDRVSLRPGRGLNETELLEIESEPARQPWLPLTIAARPESIILTVEALYWGLRESIRRLCDDLPHMEAAARFFSA